MSKDDLYTDHDGDKVAFDDLDEAEQSYYKSDCEDDISLEEYLVISGMMKTNQTSSVVYALAITSTGIVSPCQRHTK